LKAPFYRITRSSRWTEEINPWKERDRLPLFSSGLLGELVYSDQPTVIEDLHQRLSPDDPAIDYLRGFELLVTSPQFDDGQAPNMNVLLIHDRSTFPMEQIPTYVWMSNLWGRGVLNLLLRRQLQAANAQLDRELRIVGGIQRSLLPLRLPVIGGLDMAAHYQTSERSGGDYYDLFDCGDGCWGILIADVSGHGAPAAVIMAITHAIAHLHPGRGMPPGELLTFVNAKLASAYTIRNGSFVTAFYGIYDSATRRLAYARAGHNPPRLLRAGTVQGLEGAGGIPLGLVGDTTYAECELPLQGGDLLLLYTDGITEARGPDGDMFDVERLDQALLAGGQNAEAVVAAVLEAVEEFTGGAALLDDRTLLAAAVR
jgi:sigma-B regulation protein RsbU (phosphoserine phosphatase)